MIKLIACDMDGTLLDSKKRLPSDFAAVIQTLKERGTMFAVASGRQYAALRRDLLAYAEDMMFICENGALVKQKEECLLIDPIAPKDLKDVVNAVYGMPGIYPVMCRADVALVDRLASEKFVRNTHMYYPSVQVVDDLRAYCELDDVCKVAFYDELNAQTHELPELQKRLGDRLSVILSGEHWVDVMKLGVSKGRAMHEVQKKLGLLPEECMAFGDYLNDCELLEAVGESYAMENAHPELKKKAKHIAPSNDDDGVMRVIREWFGL